MGSAQRAAMAPGSSSQLLPRRPHALPALPSPTGRASPSATPAPFFPHRPSTPPASMHRRPLLPLLGHFQALPPAPAVPPPRRDLRAARIGGQLALFSDPPLSTLVPTPLPHSTFCTWRLRLCALWVSDLPGCSSPASSAGSASNRRGAPGSVPTPPLHHHLRDPHTDQASPTKPTKDPWHNPGHPAPRAACPPLCCSRAFHTFNMLLPVP